MKRFLLVVALSSMAFAVPFRVSAQPADGPQMTVRDASGDVSIAVRTLRWMPYEEYAPGDKLWGDARARVLVMEYEVVPGGSWKGLGGRNFSIQLEAHDDKGSVGRCLSSTQGDRGRCAWYNFDPRAAKITFTWRLQHPDAPKGARQKRTHAIEWRDVPLPASWAAITNQREGVWTVQGFEATTPRGTRVVLDSLGRWNSNTPDPDDDCLELNFSLFPSGKIDGLKVYVRTRTGQMIDSTGRDLMAKGNATGFSNSNPEPAQAGPMPASMVLMNMPAPGARSLRVRLDAIDDSPALSDPGWYREVKLEADVKPLPWTPEPVPPAPLAQVKGERVSATLDSIKPNAATGNYATRRVRLWLKPAKPNGVPLPWKVKGVEIRRGGLSQKVDDLEQRAGSSNTELNWHADGSPARLGESGLEFSLPVLAGEEGKPGTADFVVSATQERRTVREFKVSGLAFPARPGAVLEPGQVIEHADGSRLIVRKVGLLTSGSMSASAESILVVMEFCPAKDAVLSPNTRLSFNAGEPREENGIVYLRVAKGTSLAATSGQSGDVWLGLNSRAVTQHAGGPVTITPGATPEMDGESLERRRQSWYSAFFEMPDAQARTLNFDVRVVEVEETGAETITLPNVALPAP